MNMLPELKVPKGCKCLWIGVSGGVDSVVLLRWAMENRAQLDAYGVALKAIHVNHQISNNSNEWQQQVTLMCDAWNVPLIVRDVNVDVSRGSLEEAARKARYNVFEQVLGAGDVLALGHHQEDQAETFLLRLMRGAGIHGLAAIAFYRALGSATIWRPFLATPKHVIVNYAKSSALTWVEDESNSDTHFDRNFLRQKLLPILKERWPQAAKKISQAAQHAFEAQVLLDDYAATDLKNLDVKPQKFGCSLSIEKLKELSCARQKQALRYWLRCMGYLAPESKHLEELQKVIAAKADSTPALWLGGYGFSRFANRLYLLPNPLTPCAGVVELTKGKALLPDGSYLSVSGANCDLVVKFRKGGERSKPKGRAHSQQLKKLLQEYGIPPWLRYQVPLIFSGEDLIAVGDYWLESSCLLAIEVVWEYPQQSFEWVQCLNA